MKCFVCVPQGTGCLIKQLRVKPLDFNGGKKFHKDTSSKDQIMIIVKPNFLKFGIIPPNLSIYLEINFGVLTLQRWCHYCVPMTLRWPDFQTRGFKVEMNTLQHDQALLFFLFACPASIYFRSVVGLFVAVHLGTQFSLVEISSLL